MLNLNKLFCSFYSHKCCSVSTSYDALPALALTYPCPVRSAASGLRYAETKGQSASGRTTASPLVLAESDRPIKIKRFH